MAVVKGSQDKGGKPKGYQSLNKGANTFSVEGGKSANGKQNNKHTNKQTFPKPPITFSGPLHG